MSNEALEDCETHRAAWVAALTTARDAASIDDKLYWEHEIEAFNRTFDALEKLVTQKPAGFLRSDEFDGHVFEPRVDGDWSMLDTYLYSAPTSAESGEDLHNALQRIDTAAVGLPTFEVRHEGGLDAVAQNIVDAIGALHERPAGEAVFELQDSGWEIVCDPDWIQTLPVGTQLYTVAHLNSQAADQPAQQEPHLAEIAEALGDETIKSFGQVATGIRDLRERQAEQPAHQQEPTGPSGDRLSDFRADQWWLKELDAAVITGTPDQKRAVAVVRNLLATAEVHLQAQPAPPPVLSFQMQLNAPAGALITPYPCVIGYPDWHSLFKNVGDVVTFYATQQPQAQSQPPKDQQ